jgi:hypothetical protein
MTGGMLRAEDGRTRSSPSGRPSRLSDRREVQGTDKLVLSENGNENGASKRTVVALEELLEDRVGLAVAVVTHVGDLGEL